MSNLPIFVYGTLKRGGKKHHILCGNYRAVFTSEVSGCLHDIGAFPMADIHSAGIIRGELYYMRPSCYVDVLHMLDVLEGVNEEKPEEGFYRRYVTSALILDGDIPQALVDQVYIYASPEHSRMLNGSVIESGIWKCRK